MIYNEDKLLTISSDLEAWDAEHDEEAWFSISRFARFSVLSGLAPQLIEEPFLSKWKRYVVSPNDSWLMLEPREHTKTSQAKALACFLLCEAPDWLGGARCRIAYAGETGKFAKRAVKAARAVFETNRWILQEYGSMAPTEDLISEWQDRFTKLGIEVETLSLPEWTQAMFRTSRCVRAEIEAGNRFEEPSMWAQGMDESTTGAHGNIVMLDDPSTERSAKSVLRKEKGLGVYHDLQSQRVAGGLQLIIGTRHAEDDTHGYILDHYYEQFVVEVHTCWGDGPELEKTDFLKTGKGSFRLKERHEGGRYDLDQVSVLWEGFGQLEEDVNRGYALPQRERKMRALSELAKKMHSIPAQRWANQYLNRAIPLEDQIFSEDMFVPYETSEALRLNYYVLTDSATGEDYRSSYRVVAVVGLDVRDNAFVRDIDFGRWNPEEYCNKIIMAHLRWSPKAILLEKVSFQAFAKTTLDLLCRARGLQMPRIVDIPGRNLISKLERIEGLQPRLAAARARSDMPKMTFDRALKTKECDGKTVWNEMVSQFKRVHELKNVKGLILDVPDALSDIDVLDAKGHRLCRPPMMTRPGQGAPRETGVPAVTMRRMPERASPTLGGGLWSRPEVKRKGLWER